MDIMGVVCKQFDARPALVANRRELKVGSPLPTLADSVQTVNDFYGYDVAEAVKAFTVECGDFPDIENERMFQCWRCSSMYPAGTFSPLGYDENIDIFYWMLGNCVAGKVPACDPCCTELTVRAAAPLTEAARKAHRLHDPRRKRPRTVYTTIHGEPGNVTTTDKPASTL
jgi:hypothetical protein